MSGSAHAVHNAHAAPYIRRRIFGRITTFAPLPICLHSYCTGTSRARLQLRMHLRQEMRVQLGLRMRKKLRLDELRFSIRRAGLLGKPQAAGSCCAGSTHVRRADRKRTQRSRTAGRRGEGLRLLSRLSRCMPRG